MRGFADFLENMAKASWDDALKVYIVGLADHRVCLSAASLAIGKDRPIVALKYMFHQRKSRLAVHQSLLRSLIEYSIIGEALDIISFFRFG